MGKLWSASNVAVYGGGVREPELLDEVSQMIGDYDKQARSTSTGGGKRSMSLSVQRERTLDVADLGALPAASPCSPLVPPRRSLRRCRG